MDSSGAASQELRNPYGAPFGRPANDRRRVRFDDTLETVLAADLGTPYGAQSAWRQIVDLLGRRRAAPSARALATLRAIRDRVPVAVRAASARALEHADPPAPLVWLFAGDALQIAAPVLRSARLSAAEWVQLLPELGPGARQVLRHRRDLGPVVERALESFGAVDFVLPDDSGWTAAIAHPAKVSVTPARASHDAAAAASNGSTDDAALAADAAPAPAHIADPRIARVVELARRALPRSRAAPRVAASEAEAAASVRAAGGDEGPDLSFVALAEAAAVLPRSAASAATEPAPAAETALGEPEGASAPAPNPAAPPERVGEAAAPPASAEQGPFEISEVVARIDAFWRTREEGGVGTPRPVPAAEQFRFETDAQGLIRWVDGVSRAPVIGLTLDVQGSGTGAGVDGVASGAFRGRSSFSNARLRIEGDSDAGGDWLISGLPVFDPVDGRFSGYRGTARRPRADERAEPARPASASPAADSLRQLVHELRTPTNAIAGFAEMIESQMLGPVAEPYRARAHEIREQARELLGAIEDLDLAARIDSAALALVPASVPLRPLLSDIADELGELAALRGAMIALPVEDLSVVGDRRAVERLLSRLMATLVSASGSGERIGVRMRLDENQMVSLGFDRPHALADYPGDTVLGIDDEREDATLLGTGFALRLARNLARELGGGLTIGADSLTLRLPAAVNGRMGQAHRN